MGVTFGIHGESHAMGGREIPLMLDSAIKDDYKRSHERLILCLNESGKIKSKYFLLHSSESHPFITLWHEFQTSSLVDVWGRPMKDFFDENPDLLDWAVKQEFIVETLRISASSWDVEAHLEDHVRKFKEKNQKDPKPDDIMKMRKEIEKSLQEDKKRYLIRFISASETTYGSERIAYYVIAKWMQEGKNCPRELTDIWENVTKGKGKIEDRKFRETHQNWVPAVASAYIWGHWMQETCPGKKQGFEDPKKILDKYKMIFVLETPMSGSGIENLMRLARPLHFYYIAKNIKSDYFRIAVDAEHMISSMIDPLKEATSFPEGAGKYVRVFHVGYPAPLQPVHHPIPLGSEAQLFLYNMLWEYRKRGCKEAWVIFERGGGQDPVKETILALRLVKKYLEEDTPPEKLPEEFYGFPKGGPIITRQLLEIKEHAFDPLKGLLAVPEEEYGFLGTSAAAKQKLEEWKKEKYK